MEKIIADLEKAIAAEKKQTPALSVMRSHVQSLKERLAEHVKALAAENPAAKPAQS